MQSTFARLFRAALIAGVAASFAACGVESQDPPSLIGPSGLAQSVTLAASPDRLPRDGSSQSVITVAVRNESGQGVSGQRVTLGASAGTLSASEVVTGSDGRATFVLTAPPAGSTGTTIDVFATPVGGDFADAVTRTLSIALTGLANSGAPVASFTFTPSAPEVGQLVTFDASTSTDEGVACTSSTCTFTWSFDDGTTGTGSTVTHAFSAQRDYNVSLTVRDNAGSSTSTSRVVTVSTVAAPSVSMTVEPDPPVAGRPASFEASATAASGHSIRQYAWDFGDGTTLVTTSPEATHVYKKQGLFVAKVTVTDDLGQTASLSLPFTIVESAVHASITWSPTEPVAGQRILFHALHPTAPDGATIASFEWNFGEPLTAGAGGTGDGQTTDYAYSAPGTYVVRLTMTDTNGVQGVYTREIEIN